MEIIKRNYLTPLTDLKAVSIQSYLFVLSKFDDSNDEVIENPNEILIKERIEDGKQSWINSLW